MQISVPHPFRGFLEEKIWNGWEATKAQAYTTSRSALDSIEYADDPPMTATTPRAHGIDGTWVEPDWPPLTLDELSPILARFPNDIAPTSILTVSPRPFSAASVIATRHGRVFVKRHSRLVRDREGLLEEHRFLAYLFANGAAVPRVLANQDGETAIELGEWTYEVHQAPPGVDIYREALSWTPFLNPSHARAAGVALAQLHLAAQDYSAPRRLNRPLVAGFTIFAADNPRAALSDYIAGRPALAAYPAVEQHAQQALALLDPFNQHLLPHLRALPPLWTHNDLHASNVLWTNDPTPTAAAIIDFGLADRTNAVHDLAQAIERNIVDWLCLHPSSTPANLHVDLPALHALLEGYESIRPLADAEAAALAPMTALCHADFALSEADYFLGVLHSEPKALIALNDYLVGHARWFYSEAGSALLAALRRWEWTRKGVSAKVHSVNQAFPRGLRPR
jgi:Ser/Thr protein kinase RdoA (MazF antagonist)